jgi:hypothetical protein
MTEWQLIDVAPRNPGMTSIGDAWLIGWNPEWDEPIPIYWMYYGWVTPDQSVANYGDEGDGLYKILPTHWMPMPKAPEFTQ